MSKHELTKEDSLALITEMIGQAKRNFARGGSFHFLLWGIVVFICNVSHYTLWKFQLTDAPYLVWVLTIPAAIASIVYGARKSAKAKVKSHIDNLYGLIWLGVFISAIITLFFAASFNNANGIILIFSALGTFLSGIAIRFRALIMGSIALWVAGIIAFNLPVMDQYLVAAIGIFVGYIIPGFMLKKVESSRV